MENSKLTLKHTSLIILPGQDLNLRNFFDALKPIILFVLHIENSKFISMKGYSMRKILSVVGICCFLAVTGLGINAQPREFVDFFDEISNLKKQVSSLEERVESLEKALEESTMMRFNLPSREDGLTIKIPELLFRHQIPHKGWIPKEFNGIPYYIIPLEQNTR